MSVSTTQGKQMSHKYLGLLGIFSRNKELWETDRRKGKRVSEVEGRLRAIWKAGLSPDTAWKSLSITLTKCIVMCADVLEARLRTCLCGRSVLCSN